MTAAAATVAVVLTCFNEGAFVEGALASVLAQDAGEAIAEVVLVDDGSAAETARVLDRLEGADPRLRILRGPGGWGCAGGRNQGAAATTAPWLAFLDADDLWTPGKLSRQLQALEDDGGLDLVYTGYEALAPGAATGRARRVYDLSRHRRPARRYFLHDPPVIPSSILVRRSAFEALGGFDAAIPFFEDTDFYLRLLQRGRLKGVAEPLIRKRHRAGSMSAARMGLMAHHAYVAFAAAGRDPALAPLVGRRLAERAARLGLVAYAAGDRETARRCRAMATALAPFNPRGLGLGLLLAGGAPLRRALAGALAGRSRLHGG